MIKRIKGRNKIGQNPKVMVTIKATTIDANIVKPIVLSPIRTDQRTTPSTKALTAKAKQQIMLQRKAFSHLELWSKTIVTANRNKTILVNPNLDLISGKICLIIK